MVERKSPGEVIYSEPQRAIDELMKEHKEMATDIEYLNKTLAELQEDIKLRLELEQAHLEFLQSEQQDMKQMLMEARTKSEIFKEREGFETPEELQNWIRNTQEYLEKLEHDLKNADNHREKLIKDYLDEISETKGDIIKFEELKSTIETLMTSLAEADKKMTEVLKQMKSKIKH